MTPSKSTLSFSRCLFLLCLWATASMSRQSPLPIVKGICCIRCLARHQGRQREPENDMMAKCTGNSKSKRPHDRRNKAGEMRRVSNSVKVLVLVDYQAECKRLVSQTW
ncbi:hypothetical protein GE09DRAFT_412611 [Coniochaeta sp. 2T2.1]|nr:hypothetical protein GE09DRAFT_412611 [Coniochaeta sp. 2T2.1]